MTGIDSNKVHIRAINGTSTEILNRIAALMDHALLNKSDVAYREDRLQLKIRRNLIDLRKRRWTAWHIWWKGRYPTIWSELTVRKVLTCNIQDASHDEEIILGGISIEADQVCIGNFCDRESTYTVTATVESIDIELKDL